MGYFGTLAEELQIRVKAEGIEQYLSLVIDCEKIVGFKRVSFFDRCATQNVRKSR